jgi:GPI ethanolamine phosphate transferase 1
MTFIGLLSIFFESKILGRTGGLSRAILGVQVGLVILSLVVTRSSVLSLQAKEGLPLGTQIVGWIVMGLSLTLTLPLSRSNANVSVASLTLPFLHALDPISHYLHRFLVLFLAFAPTFVILTISYEGLFYVAFCTTMLTWIQLEHLIYKSLAPASTSFRSLTLADARPSLFTLYFLQSAFFSTGNIASVSSFSLDAVSRLIPVFDPFSQAALLILKILAPFVILSAAMGVLNKRLGFAPGALFMGLIVFGDWLTINFFWMVRDEGSWLEIGETISRFMIVSGLCVFAAALETGSGWLVGDVDDTYPVK